MAILKQGKQWRLIPIGFALLLIAAILPVSYFIKTIIYLIALIAMSYGFGDLAFLLKVNSLIGQILFVLFCILLMLVLAFISALFVFY